MSDMDTSALDGMACHVCGDDAVDLWTIAEGTRLMDRPLCEACANDAITKCPTCDTTIWQQDGYRIYSTPDLYCPSCASRHPALVEGRHRELRRDERAGK